ncbi:MAG TPA: hypothetical protein ENI55_05255 [Alphaproteobacteria bacterium]|nr:hypothetical protein [Alphaproteobacteria bacterium]
MAKTEYEIHILKKGRWTIDHIVSDDKEAAINEAREMTTDKYIDGVKVIEESVINDEGETRSRTVFNNTKKKRVKKGKTESRAEDSKPDKKKKKRSGTANLLIALVVVAVILVGLIVITLAL